LKFLKARIRAWARARASASARVRVRTRVRTSSKDKGRLTASLDYPHLEGEGRHFLKAGFLFVTPVVVRVVL